VTASQGFSCNAANPLVCTLPAGTVPGTYTVDYTAKVNAQAKGSVSNAVLGSGTGVTTCTSNCGTTTPVLSAVVTYRKQSTTVAPVDIGDAVDYSVEVTVANSQTARCGDPDRYPGHGPGPAVGHPARSVHLQRRQPAGEAAPAARHRAPIRWAIARWSMRRPRQRAQCGAGQWR
jgi:hypothetical protein